MNDKWQAALTGGPNMTTKTLALPVERFRKPKISQSRFANGHNFGMFGHFRQLLCAWNGSVFVVRMDADRSEQIRVRSHKLHQTRPLRHVYTDHQRMAHLILLHARQDIRQVLCQLRKIKVTM